MRGKEEASFAIYYDMEGNVCDVEITPKGEENNCRLTASGPQLSAEEIQKIISQHKYVEVKSHNVIKLSGSPDCIIYINNIPICICCG